MKMGRGNLFYLGVCALLLNSVQSLAATTVRALSLEEMVKAADRIFVGKCVSVDSRRDEYGFTATYVTFQVVERIKGDLGEKITIKQIGGDPSGIRRVPDLPTYKVGEEVLLFLHPASQYGFTSPVGLQQGKWTVLDSGSGKKMLRRSLSGVLIDKGSAGLTYGLGKDQDLIPYTPFLSRVKRLVAQHP